MSSSNTATDTQSPEQAARWVSVCTAEDLIPNVGLGALVNQQQIAIFYVEKLDKIYAISNFDPISKANVLARGIVGSQGERVVVASPLYKQHFDLENGECLEDPEHDVPAYPARLVDGRVEVKI